MISNKIMVVPMDIHSGSIAYGIFKDGDLTNKKRFETSEKNLRGLGRLLNDYKKEKEVVVIIEETNLASWVVDIFSDMNIDVIVSDPKENTWIYKDEKKDDFRDCRKLGALYEAELIKEINKPPQHLGNIRTVVTRYIQIMRNVSSEKNRIKALLRNKGIFKTDDNYSDDLVFKQIDKSYNKDNKIFIATMNEMLSTLKKLEKAKNSKIAMFKNFAKHYPEVKILCSIPGIKIVRAVIIFSAIFNINRFANYKKLNSYAGLGIVQKSSDEWEGHQHLTNSCNKLLKWCVKNATLSAIECNSYFGELYKKSKKEVGKEYKVILKLSRKMGKVIYNCLNKMKPYDILYPMAGVN